MQRLRDTQTAAEQQPEKRDVGVGTQAARGTDLARRTQQGGDFSIRVDVRRGPTEMWTE